jgi:hypothetical protein
VDLADRLEQDRRAKIEDVLAVAAWRRPPHRRRSRSAHRPEACKAVDLLFDARTRSPLWSSTPCSEVRR